MRYVVDAYVPQNGKHYYRVEPHGAHYLDGQDRVTPNGLINLRFEAEGPNSYVIVIGPNKSERFDARPEELAS